MNQNILFSFSQKDNDNLIKNFHEKKLDLIFTVEQIKNVESQVVAMQELSFVVSREHPLAHQKNIKLKDVENENFILINPETNLRRVIDKEFKTLNFKPKIYLEMSSCINILTYVEKNFGISIVPKVDILDSKKNVVPIDIEGIKMSRVIFANWSPCKKESVSLRRLKDFIDDFFK